MTAPDAPLNCVSKIRDLPGSRAMGANLEILENLSETNDIANCVPQDDRFRFIDDLTTLEVIKLLSVGLSTYNVKQHVPSDIPTHGQIIDRQHLKSQQYLNEINKWSNEHMMKINKKKTKAMLFNFTHNFQFTTNLCLEDEQIEIVQKMKILGTIISENLSWDANCENIIRKVTKRMQMLVKCHSFGASNSEMVILWISFCRSVLEQSCVVWDSSLTVENISDLERLQKSFCKLVLNNEFESYETCLDKLNLQKLSERRKELTLKFAKNALKNQTMKDIFLENKKSHDMVTRKAEKWDNKFANTERLKKCGILKMISLLNDSEQVEI